MLEKAKDCIVRKEQQAPAFATYEIGRIYFKRGEVNLIPVQFLEILFYDYIQVEKAKVALAKAKVKNSTFPSPQQ